MDIRDPTPRFLTSRFRKRLRGVLLASAVLASSGWRPGIPLNCRRTAPPSQHRSPAPNVSSAGAEKPGLQAPSGTCVFSSVRWRRAYADRRW